MKCSVRCVLFCLVSLLASTRGFVVLPGLAATRHATGVSEHSERTQSKAAATGRSASTKRFAKASYKNFEDMLAKEPGALLVDFYATWCGPCKMMAETLSEVGPKLKGEVKIFKIDSDKYPALMTKFGVNGLPTLILFKEGKELERIEGMIPAEPLMQQVRYWLAGAEAGDGDQSTQGDACAPPPQDACAPPRDACSPPPSEE